MNNVSRALAQTSVRPANTFHPSLLAVCQSLIRRCATPSKNWDYLKKNEYLKPVAHNNNLQLLWMYLPLYSTHSYSSLAFFLFFFFWLLSSLRPHHHLRKFWKHTSRWANTFLPRATSDLIVWGLSVTRQIWAPTAPPLPPLICFDCIFE